MKGTPLFKEEYDHLGKLLPEALWEKESDYPPLRGENSNPFRGLARGMDALLPSADAPVNEGTLGAGQDALPIPGTGLLGYERTAAVDAL